VLSLYECAAADTLDSEEDPGVIISRLPRYEAKYPGEKTVWLIRQGQAKHNEDPQEGYKKRDPRLTKVGKQQAKALRKDLKARKAKVEVVLSSPLSRALQTSQIVFPSRKVIPLAVLQEMSDVPCDTGRPREELAEKFPNISFARLDEEWYVPGKGKNSAGQVERFLEWLSEQAYKEVAVVAHNILLKFMTGHRFGNAEARKYIVLENGEWILPDEDDEL
jgi:broad specificity phosphatase PhoE